MDASLVLAFAIITVLLIVLFFGRHIKKEDFLGGTLDISVSWSTVTSPVGGMISYQWYACPSTPACSSTDPTTWPYSGTTTSTNVSLNTSNCASCDFGQAINFAVIAIDSSSGEKSVPGTTTLNLASSTAQDEIFFNFYDPSPSSSGPIEQGTTSIDVVVGLKSSANLPTTYGGEVYLSIVRGTTPPIISQEPLAIVPPTLNGYQATIDISTTSISSFQQGDQLSFASVLYDPTTTPPNIVVYITATYTVPAPPAPTSPSGFSFSIQPASS